MVFSRTLLANLLVPLGIFIFSTGFFPYKPLLPGLATEVDNAPPVFDKVIFMVVDALRRYGHLRSRTQPQLKEPVILCTQTNPDFYSLKGQAIAFLSVL